MAAKLSKKELKQPDVFQSTFEKIVDYISENTMRFYAIATTVVLTVVIAFGIYLYWSNYQTTAAQIYAKAQASLYQAGDKPGSCSSQCKNFSRINREVPA